MKDIKENYGNEAFYIQYGNSASLVPLMARSWPPDTTAFAKLLNCYGGYLDHYSDYSTAPITQA